MSLGACVFEKQSVLFASGQLPAEESPEAIVKVGAPSDEDGAGFNGVLLRFRFAAVEGEGDTDTGAIITMRRSFDGVATDDAYIDQFAIPAVNIGEYPNVWYQTVVYPAFPGESGLPPCGYAIQPYLDAEGGNRAVMFQIHYRRWRWKLGL